MIGFLLLIVAFSFCFTLLLYLLFGVICHLIFDEPEPPCFEAQRFEELPQSAELKRCEIDYEHSRCIKDGVQIVTLWWLPDIDGLQMQKDGTIKRVGRKAEQEQFAEALTNMWKAQTRLAKMRYCGRDEDGYLIFDDYPEYETVTDIAGNQTVFELYH